jgi:2-polyprenyl-3-methyl-5-hydroxy-6-metoxy-1,4-benzoquinol methylase
VIDDTYTASDHEFRDDDSYAETKYRLTLRWLGHDDGTSKLFNIGCGHGRFNTMAHDAGYRVSACEPDPAASAVATANAPAGCTVYNCGVLELPKDLRADVVVMHDVLEHIDAEAAAVARVADLLRPGGRLVMSVPALPVLFGYHDEQLGHFRRYGRSSLKTALGRHFHIERLRYFGFTLIPVTAWYSKVRRVAYPTASASGGGLVGSAFRALCRAEERVPAPIGTSLICLATSAGDS